MLALPGLAQNGSIEKVNTKFEKGTVTDNRRTGRWEYYDGAGRLELIMNYDSSRVAYMPADTAHYIVWLDNAWNSIVPNRPPRMMASTVEYLLEAGKTIQIPQPQTEGRVVYSFVVNEQGRTEDLTVEEAMPTPFMEQTLRAFQKMPPQWIPAIARGRAVKTRCYFVVYFLKGSSSKLEKLSKSLPKLPKTYRSEIVVTALR
ncbi:TonB-like protein [Hymenobacter chitinivorans DSM 11115]|uniref:TonB-like protein n=1 Tax=Hymenobacter chitinivorans DSM 11115 TaxID=1121954 RepID=A0A2M9AQN4_9BACT|nr:TonB-like protein [Hymenobacter chitinivorans DSM 11115]